MVGSKVKVRGGDGSHSPLGLGGEGRSLVVGRRRDDDFIAVFVDGFGGCGSDLTLFLGLFLDLCNLLSLLRGGTDLHAEDDVSDLRLSQ